MKGQPYLIVFRVDRNRDKHACDAFKNIYSDPHLCAIHIALFLNPPNRPGHATGMHVIVATS